MAFILVRDADNYVLEVNTTAVGAGPGQTEYNEVFTFIPTVSDATWLRLGAANYIVVNPNAGPLEAGNETVRIEGETTEGETLSGTRPLALGGQDPFGNAVYQTYDAAGRLRMLLESTLNLQDEGVPVVGGPHTSVNYVGPGVDVTNAGLGVATVTITGGGGGSSDPGALVTARDTGTDLIASGASFISDWPTLVNETDPLVLERDDTNTDIIRALVAGQLHVKIQFRAKTIVAGSREADLETEILLNGSPLGYAEGGVVLFNDSSVVPEDQAQYGQQYAVIQVAIGDEIQVRWNHSTISGPTDAIQLQTRTIQAFFPQGFAGATGPQGIQGIPGTNTIIGQDEGSPVAGGPFTTVNLIGAGVVASNGGAGVLDVTVTAGGGATDNAAALTDNAIVRGDTGANDVQTSIVSISDTGEVTGVSRVVADIPTVFKSVSTGAAQALGATFLTINMDAATLDQPATAFTQANGEITVDEAGIYLVHYWAGWSQTGNNRVEVEVQLEVNNTLVPGTLFGGYSRNNVAGDGVVSLTIPMVVVASDTFRIRIRRSGGTAAVGTRPNGSGIAFTRIS